MNLINFLKEIGKLKKVKRTGWVLRGIKNPESVAEHTYRTTIMAMVLADRFKDKLKLDKDKLIQIALIHDIAEARVGDITPHEKISEKEKHELEKKAAKRIFSNLDPESCDYYYNLLQFISGVH